MLKSTKHKNRSVATVYGVINFDEQGVAKESIPEDAQRALANRITFFVYTPDKEAKKVENPVETNTEDSKGDSKPETKEEPKKAPARKATTRRSTATKKTTKTTKTNNK